MRKQTASKIKKTCKMLAAARNMPWELLYKQVKADYTRMGHKEKARMMRQAGEVV